MEILVTENLRKYYQLGDATVRALDGVSLTVEKGEFIAIVGRSGSGKSTLLHMLGGLDVPTSGTVIVDGRDISGMTKDELTIFRRRKIGFVFQNYNLLPLMNVYENIILPIQLDGIKPDRKFVENILEKMCIRDSIKTVALMSAMACSGLHVPCREADICMQNQILCDIGDGQNISDNLSTFSAHIKNVLDILKRVRPDSLVIMDELGSGTAVSYTHLLK